MIEQLDHLEDDDDDGLDETEALRQALRPAWVVPLAGGALELALGLGVCALGVYYDYIARLPGPLVMLGVAVVLGRWMALARLQWAAAQRYIARSRRRSVVITCTERAMQRHGRSAVLHALRALDTPHRKELPP